MLDNLSDALLTDQPTTSAVLRVTISACMRSNTQMKNIVYALSALVCALWTINSITKQNNTVWVRFIPQWKFSASLSTFASVKPGTHWQQSWKLNSTRSTLLEVDCCRNRQQIGNKVDCRRYDRLCCQCVPVFKLLFQFRCSMTFNIDDSQHKGTVSTKPVFEKIAKIQRSYVPLCGHTTFVLLTPARTVTVIDKNHNGM